jgi:hypothetical protein
MSEATPEGPVAQLGARIVAFKAKVEQLTQMRSVMLVAGGGFEPPTFGL